MRSFSLLPFAGSRASSDFGIGKQGIALILFILFKIIRPLLFTCYKLKLFSDYLLQFTDFFTFCKAGIRNPLRDLRSKKDSVPFIHTMYGYPEQNLLFITHTYFTAVFTVTVFPYLSFETSFNAVFFFCCRMPFRL